ncbi:Mini-ribonuclease 3 [Inconstantimicrobium mannanitabidum]|uniref:Mini-ribonuclease 3 n=1 Tax=Inconstantimicrobium mannanitabidum TaxID=1604901 RepID=A0ACB5RIA4_9CLOT|nr:ribonuclease III domain-containing protein [Clostridium sp. TW13]GKX68797.1 mini-ribonuclease 3 [Clostridium sp. TW13]
MENLLIQQLSDEEVRRLNPLQLALIGDAAYEVYIRNYILLNNRELNAHKIHVKAIKFVKAKAQSDIMLVLENELLEAEEYFYKRGRNAKSPTVPKNADVRDYRNATGFEALIGYLYLTGKNERLESIFKKCVQIIEEKS